MTNPTDKQKKKLRRIPFVGHLIQFEVDQLLRAVLVVESGVRQESKDHDDWVERMAEGLTPDERAEHFDRWVDEHVLLSEAVPQWSRRALFLCIYGTFEHAVKTICEDAYHDKLTSEKPKSVYMSNAATYLTNHVKVDAAAFGVAWNMISDARVLRNIVAHNNGVLRPSKACTKSEVERAIAFVRGQPALSTDKATDSLKIGEGFCGTFVEAASNALTSLWTGLKVVSPPGRFVPD